MDQRKNKKIYFPSIKTIFMLVVLYYTASTVYDSVQKAKKKIEDRVELITKR